MISYINSDVVKVFRKNFVVLCMADTQGPYIEVAKGESEVI